jgi:predicted AlkP superfamily phosphohydrolase/phosphomutase
LSPTEFLAQSDLVMDESRRMLDFELARFAGRRGAAFLFFYFSSVDQRHHMMGRHVDAAHPAHAPDTPVSTMDSMRSTYREIDRLIGRVLEQTGRDVAVVVMSDHGFSNFYREAHLNAWLRQAGYLALKEDAARDAEEWLPGIDWSRTRAFSIGLNSLYINVAGRERFGIVPAAERLDLARQIAGRLQGWTDETTGLPVVTRASLREEIYRGPYLADAPDIIVGYGDGYRGSWATSKGQTAPVLLEDNVDEWSADHCVDPAVAPGVLVSNLKLTTASPELTDLTVGILEYFGVAREPAMRGTSPF